jgi:hypothetical protein
MKYIANYKLTAFVEKNQNSIIFNGLSTLIFIIFPCVYVLFVDNGIAMDVFWLYEIGLIVINSVTFFGFYKKGKLQNRTIRTIEEKGGNLTIETYRFYILKFWCIKQKMKSVKLSELKFFLDTYPLKDKNYILNQSCFSVKIGGDFFYFLNNFFDDEVLKFVDSNNLDIHRSR